MAAARRARADADAESRQPRMLARFQRQTRAELGAAGSPLLAARSERIREDWVRDHLVQVGKSRAQVLGWPDAYAYSKALGERALLETRGDLPVTIVRPSIIEASLAEPEPGWIRGFRMADPVIISYGKGLLKAFPGVPEGVIDVIPVDLVVAAILAVAGRGPLAEPDVFHAASGARNPLRYRQLVDLVQTWFVANPLADNKDQPITVPELAFPGRRRVQRQLDRATKALAAGERALQTLPLRGRQADLAARLEERRVEVERALSYVELYGAYAETEAIFSVDRLLELFSSLPESDRRDFCFDPSVIDWRHFCHDVYLPSVVAHARVRLAGPLTGAGLEPLPARERPSGEPAPYRPRAARGTTGMTREERGRKAVLSPERQLAVFDLENTLIASNVVDSYAWLATRHAGRPRPGPVRAADPSGGPPAARSRPGRPQRLPALFLPPLRGGAGGPAAAATAGSCSATWCSPSRSRPVSAGSASTGRSGTRLCSSPGPSMSSSNLCGPSSTRSSAPGSGKRAAVSPASSSRPLPPGRPGPSSWPITPDPSASTSSRAWLTPTRRAICPCSRPRAIRWR